MLAGHLMCSPFSKHAPLSLSQPSRRRRGRSHLFPEGRVASARIGRSVRYRIHMEPEPRDAVSTPIRVAQRNELDRVAALRAEYRDRGEAGVLAQGPSDLLVAR